MAKIHIEIDGRTWFDAEVEGFAQPPTLPDNPKRMHIDAMPAAVRDVLDRALLKGLEQVGLRVLKWERI